MPTKLLTVCIHQPDFAPYLGFFHRLLLSDHFVLLDDAQFIKGGWQNRDRIKGKNGPVWLTLSINKRFPQRINEVILSDNPQWVENNLNLLRDCYRHSRCFDEVFPRIEAIYRDKYRRMVDFNVATLELALAYFEITIPITYASQYAIEAKSNARLITLIQLVGGDNYLTGMGSRDYLEKTLFEEAGITVQWQQFKHPVYPQINGAFEPMLSCLDVLFNCGRDSASILRSTLE
jgi:hypothetical protein